MMTPGLTPEEEDAREGRHEHYARPRGVAWTWIISVLSALTLLGAGTIVTEQISLANRLQTLSEREATGTARMQGEIDVLDAQVAAAQQQIGINTGRLGQVEKALAALEQRIESMRSYQLRNPSK